MKALIVSAFLTLIALNAFSQIPTEIDFESRLAEYQQVQDRFLRLQARSKKLRAQAEELNAELDDTQIRLQKRKEKRKLNIARLAEVESLMINTINTTTELTAKKKELEGRQVELKAKIIKLNAAVNNKKAKLDQIKPKIQETEAKLKVIDTKIASMNSIKKQAMQNYNNAKKLVIAANTKLKRIDASKQELENALKKQKAVLANLPADSPKVAILKKGIADNKVRLAGFENRKVKEQAIIKNNKVKMSEAEKVIKTQGLKISELDTQKKNIITAAGAIYQQFEEAKASLQTAKANETKAKESLLKVSENIGAVGQKINHKKTKLVKLRQEKKGIAAEQLKIKEAAVRLNQKVKRLIPAVNESWTIFEEVKDKRVRANRRAERLYAIYQETKNRFDSYMSAAIETGKNQGMSLGVNLGSEAGDKQGDLDGSKDALTLGKELGLLKGFLNGLKDGHQSGKDRGYQTGYNLPNNYDRGYKLGLDAGKEQAYTDAENEDYPKGRIAKQKELLSRALNGSSLNSKANDAQSFSMALDTSYHYEGLKNTNNKASGDAVLDLINSIEAKIADLEKQVDILLANPSTQIKIDVPNVLGSLRCPVQYPANYIEFLEACKESYLNKFDQSYVQNYQAEYNQSYLRNFEKSLNEQEIKHQNLRTKEGYDKAYAPTFNKYKLIGAKDAQNQGFNDGHKKAYKENIKTARKLAFNRGQKDEQQYFNTHAVIRILKAGLKSNEDKFIPGAKAKLAIELGNFGSIATSEDEVTLKVFSEDSGLVFTETKSTVSGIKGISKISNTAILEATVGPNVQPGQKLALKVNIYLNDKMVDSQSITVTGGADYQASAVVVTNLSPKFRTFSRKETALITVTNDSRTKLLSNLSVKMSSSNSIISIQNMVLNLGVLAKGDTGKVTFEYKGKKKLRGKKITLTFDILYKGQIIKTEKVVIKPI